MKIEIWSVGKDNGDFIESGIKYYLKKLKPFCTLDFIFINPPKRTTAMPIDQMKKAEEKLILEKIQPAHYLILLDEKGKSLTSIAWANELEKLKDSNTKTLVFLIGGPWGITENVRKAAKQTWNLSTLTFPHQLVRLIMAEQLYRSFSIMNNSAYHHE